MSIGDLECKCWEDRSKIGPVLEVSRAEEARSDLSIYKVHPCERLSNSRVPHPWETSQLVYAPFVNQSTFKLGWAAIRVCSQSDDKRLRSRRVRSINFRFPITSYGSKMRT